MNVDFMDWFLPLFFVCAIVLGIYKTYALIQLGYYAVDAIKEMV